MNFLSARREEHEEMVFNAGHRHIHLRIGPSSRMVGTLMEVGRVRAGEVDVKASGESRVWGIG